MRNLKRYGGNQSQRFAGSEPKTTRSAEILADAPAELTASGIAEDDPLLFIVDLDNPHAGPAVTGQDNCVRPRRKTDFQRGFEIAIGCEAACSD